MNLPLAIYLDSSDFSDLSNERKIEKEPELENIRDELLHLMETDQIEIRYSSFHILEAAHLTPESKPMALKRAATIQSFCGSKALIHYQDLFHKEIVALATHQKGSCRHKAYSDKSDWMPDFGNLLDGLQEGFRMRSKEDIRKTGAPRATRRAIEKRLFKSDGTFTAEGLNAFETSHSMLELKKQLPITDDFYQSKMLAAYVKGKIDASAINKEIKKGICDPINFIGWYAEKDGAKEMLGWLRGAGLANLNNIHEMRSEVERLCELAPIIGKTHDDVSIELKNTLDRTMQNVRNHHIEFFLNKELLKKNDAKKMEEQARNSQIGSLPGLDALMAYFRQYSEDNVAPSVYPRKLRQSDMGDAFHCIYLPYVDIFRADGYTSKIVAGITARLGTTVVPSLLELPNAITNALHSRAD